jgi:FkbM family methyltransferase
MLLSRPFRSPVSAMSMTSSAMYRLRWEVGYRLIGPNSWARRVRTRLSYERWVASHVKGWFHFLLWRLGIKVHFSAISSGQVFQVRSVAERNELSRHLKLAFRAPPFAEEVLGKEVGLFRLNYGGREVSFPYDRNRYGVMTVLNEFFVREPFAQLRVDGADVLDVGSCIGDTPIYFALRGAGRVIALEPYPATFEWARKNISSNGFGDKVMLLNEGAGTSGSMRLSRAEMNFWADAVPTEDGQEVRFNSLKEIIDRFEIKSAVLKYHGEGSEYEFFANASLEDLAHFNQIVLKYHYGAAPIIRKLKQAGFVIKRKWDLHFSYNPSSSHPRYHAGLILAERPDMPSVSA